MLGEFDPKINPMEREYTLRCKVFVGRKTTKQGSKDAGSEYQYVCLIPQDSDEMVKFYNAWLPDDEASTVECLVSMGRPIYGSCRMSVHRSNENYKKGPHLFVMSKGVEDILISKKGEIVEIKVEKGTADAGDAHESDTTDSAMSVEKFR